MTQGTEGQSEKQFSDAVVEYARLCGWLVHRDPTWRATGADPGYPDLTLARDGRVIFRELKVGKGQPTAAQMEWILILPNADIWRPEDWPKIEEFLR